MEKSLISGILQRANLNSFMISSIVEAGNVGQIFRRLAQERINIEFINQVPQKNGYNNVILCVDSKNAHFALALLEEIKPVIKAREIYPLNQVGILSIYPHREHALVISIIVQALSGAKIPLLAMGSSISAISCVISHEKVPDAIKVLSNEFGLG